MVGRALPGGGVVVPPPPGPAPRDLALPPGAAGYGGGGVCTEAVSRVLAAPTLAILL
jgi:hypothetical protein